VALFKRYIGVDYSGAETPTSSLEALRVYEADAEAEPREVKPQLALGSTGLVGASPNGCVRN
jgi:hypothetical protein